MSQQVGGQGRKLPALLHSLLPKAIFTINQIRVAIIMHDEGFTSVYQATDYQVLLSYQCACKSHKSSPVLLPCLLMLLRRLQQL